MDGEGGGCNSHGDNNLLNCSGVFVENLRSKNPIDGLGWIIIFSYKLKWIGGG